MNQVSSALAKRLKIEMDRKDLNARELAELAGLGSSLAYDILSGKSTNPTTKKLSAVAKVLGVSVLYLMHGEESSNESGALLSFRQKAAELVAIPSIVIEESKGGRTLATRDYEGKPY